MGRMKRELEKDRARKSIDDGRPDALVVLDAVLAHDTRFDDQLVDFVKTAIRDYRIVWPESRIDNPWRIIWQPGRRQEVFCTFCGLRLLSANGPRRGEPSLTSRLHKLSTMTPAQLRECGDCVITHIRICALLCLAKLRWYANPKTRLLEAEGDAEVAS